MTTSSDIAISVRGLGKSYTIAHQQGEKHSTLAETALARLRNPFRRPERETFWALKDVSFDIRKGDVVGIIGRNGAGKSTLLKVLSRITEPTTGEIDVYGRIGSLLEVGTGFHPELTGRENVFLNGAILGMSKAEIRKQFDAIVDFAGVEKFLDTPVKRYSSGMYVRLAFAVAAHLRSEILIVDEVLAVGDAEFQKRCLGKMKDVSSDGRTVLFVSHNMTAMMQLCSSAILLQHGWLKRRGSIESVLPHYLTAGTLNHGTHWKREDTTFDKGSVRPLEFFLGTSHGDTVALPVRNDSEYSIYAAVEIIEMHPAIEIGYAVFDQEGRLVYYSFHTDGPRDRWPVLRNGKIRLSSPWPKHLLNEGTYRVELGIALNQIRWLVEPDKNAPAISVEIVGGLSDSPHFNHKREGLLAPVLDWEAVEVVA